MKYRIGPFEKTEHFLYRQWDRVIDDTLLEPILKKLKPNNEEVLYIISLKILKKINKTIQEELFIKIKGKVLITCFHRKFQEYRNDKHIENYKIISKL